MQSSKWAFLVAGATLISLGLACGSTPEDPSAEATLGSNEPGLHVNGSCFASPCPTPSTYIVPTKNAYEEELGQILKDAKILSAQATGCTGFSVWNVSAVPAGAVTVKAYTTPIAVPAGTPILPPPANPKAKNVCAIFNPTTGCAPSTGCTNSNMTWDPCCMSL